ncbi:hypothetical protein A1D30_05535 [Acidovorax sp. GW101-3H11]|uniref:DUF3102 domain-containing protein n=1 Tax=Acidovorax sp. GW101-3H11 TaxID=1813946 RepID=UPI0007B542A8|nr:DUF3102 domain-containing protein [Acidovorax sp. GW101-3H11]KZT11673.1 hypothetical protein A1D30_05535 [Acidovorax sp. GW101-3H11]
MARNTTPAPASKEVIADAIAIGQTMDAANQLAVMSIEANAHAVAMAQKIGYQGAVTVGALEDEIRFYQRRTVEAILETGKRLLVLKELTPHGEFSQRVEMLGFSDRTARRFMQAAVKTSKSANLAVLSTQVKSASAFLELVTHDDDVLENLAEMDDVEKMSASELRAALREAREEKGAVEKVLADKNTAMDKLRAQVKRIEKLPPDEQRQSLMKEATAIAHDALGAIRGGVRAALAALSVENGLEVRDLDVFMAGLVGQLQAELAALREEFNLPDVSNAADAALAAEVDQWAK